MGERHILGTTADAPWLQFPKDFCLEALKNGSCNAPAGVSAVVYDTNPLVILIFISCYLLHLKNS